SSDKRDHSSWSLRSPSFRSSSPFNACRSSSVESKTSHASRKAFGHWRGCMCRHCIGALRFSCCTTAHSSTIRASISASFPCIRMASCTKGSSAPTNTAALLNYPGTQKGHRCYHGWPRHPEHTAALHPAIHSRPAGSSPLSPGEDRGATDPRLGETRVARDRTAVSRGPVVRQDLRDTDQCTP